MPSGATKVSPNEWRSSATYATRRNDTTWPCHHEADTTPTMRDAEWTRQMADSERGTCEQFHGLYLSGALYGKLLEFINTIEMP